MFLSFSSTRWSRSATSSKQWFYIMTASRRLLWYKKLVKWKVLCENIHHHTHLLAANYFTRAYAIFLLPPLYFINYAYAKYPPIYMHFKIRCNAQSKLLTLIHHIKSNQKGIADNWAQKMQCNIQHHYYYQFAVWFFFWKYFRYITKEL